VKKRLLYITGYSWEGIRQVRATLLGARHVPERPCAVVAGYVYLGRYVKCSTFTFTFLETCYLHGNGTAAHCCEVDTVPCQVLQSVPVTRQ